MDKKAGSLLEKTSGYVEKRMSEEKLRGRLSDRDWQYVYARAPRLCADLVVQRDQRVLLLWRKVAPCPDQWELPGGTVRYGETLDVAVRRICQELTGLRVKEAKYLGICEIMKYLPVPAYQHIMDHVFLVTPEPGAATGSDKGWVSWFAEAPDLLPFHEPLVRRALDGTLEAWGGVLTYGPR